MREADLLVHVVDVSHPDFMEQIEVVNNTLHDLGCSEKPQLLVFNKTDAYTWTEKDPDDLTPATKENVSLNELMHTWMAKMGDDCIFISARERHNIDELKSSSILASSNSTCRSILITTSSLNITKKHNFIPLAA